MLYEDALFLSFILGLMRWAVMGYAAWHDARTRTFPNGLAAVFVFICAANAFLNGGLTDLAIPDGMGGLQDGGFLPTFGFHVLCMNTIAAVATFALLFAFELLWRRVRKTPGIGIGDLKFLFGLMLFEPVTAMLAFIFGLLAMAIAALLLRKKSLPLLPFVVGCYCSLLLAGIAVAFWM